MTQKKQNKAINAQGYTEFKIYSEIHGKITRFGLEIYDWAFFIFLTTASILIFIKKYKKNKPDFYTNSLLSFIFAKKELYVLNSEKEK